MAFPLVVPGDDGAGTIDRVGAGIPAGRIGERVWVHLANHQQAFGTTAEFVLIADEHAIELPDHVSFDVGTCLGVPALTAHRAVFADGPVTDQTVLVMGGAGAVGRYAIQFARLGGATVIATASTVTKRTAASAAGAEEVYDYRDASAVEAMRRRAGSIDRIIEVDLGKNLPLTAELIAANGTIAAYGSAREPEPSLPFYALMRRGITLRTISVFTMSDAARRLAIATITTLLRRDALSHQTASRHPLAATADAHRAVEDAVAAGKVLVMP